MRNLTIPANTKVFFGTPTLHGHVDAAFSRCFNWTSHVLRDHGIEHDSQVFAGSPPTAWVRNILIAAMMAQRDMTHIMYLDADLGWHPDSVLRLLAATSCEDSGVVCGVYRKRCQDLLWPCNFPPGDPIEHPITGYIELRDAPTGFMVIRRDVIQRMMDGYPELACSLRADTPEAEIPWEYDLFDYPTDHGATRYGRPVKLTEDFAFCRRWQAIGGRVWGDPKIALEHDGFRGCFGDLFQKVPVCQ